MDGQPLTLTPTFSSSAIAYTASVDSAVPWLTVTPTVSDSGATITVNTPVLSAAITVDSAAASPLLLLNTGANAIEIVITAADGSPKTYTVTVTRPDGGCGASTGIQAAQTRLLADCATLLGLKAALVGSGTELDWAANTDIRNWEGITISGNRVDKIILSYKGLAGVIPPELGSLSNLTDLSLNSNRLTGKIPTELGRLTHLTELFLNNNQLTDEIPSQLGVLSNLTDLSLRNNRLTGEIPSQLGVLSGLTFLYLSNNQLTGKIPSQLGRLTNLTELFLYTNQLTGSIPPELGSLTSLDRLWLHCNRLTGGIPAELVALNSKLSEGLWLQGNPLDSVAIPSGLTAGKVRLSGAKGSWTAAVWCGPPAFADSSATRTLVDGTASGQDIGAPVAATDPDNRPIPNTQTLTYTLGGTDASHFTIDSATGQLSVGSAALDYANPADDDTDNDYEVTVTASDGVAANANGGSATIPVTVKVTRAAAPASTDATLSGLTISPGTLRETFAPSVITYTAQVPYNVSSITVTPTASHSGATITMGTGSDTVASGAASDAQDLDVGDNAIVITVTAEAGNTKTYTVTVGRAAKVYLPDWGGVEGAAVAGDDGVTLTWQAPTTGAPVKGYRILRREAGFTAYVEIHDTTTGNNPTATTYVDPHSSAESGKDYLYRVKAVNTQCMVGPDWYAGDGSGWPDRENFGRAAVQTHSTPLSVPAAPAVAPVAPQMGNGSDAAGSNNGKVNGATAGSSGITVTWQAPTNAGSGSATVLYYLILRREDGERLSNETALIANKHLAGSEHKYRKIHNTYLGVSPTATTYTDTAVVSGKTYLYRVRAVNNNCFISPDPTRHDQTGYSFNDNNFGKATAQ